MSDTIIKSKIDVIKAISIFFSSVVLATASIIVTHTFNKQQLEISQKQAASQMQITRIKEISNIIPKLGSGNANERKFSAITLSMYGKSAIPALLALLGDENIEVRNASSKALLLIGEDAYAAIKKAFNNDKNSDELRSMCIYTLGFFKKTESVGLAMSALTDDREDVIVRKDAATALGLLKDKRSVKTLLTMIQSKPNYLIVETSIWALGEIGEKDANEELMRSLNDINSQVRIQAVWAIAKINGKEAESTLRNISENNIYVEVRQNAKSALIWISYL